MILFVVGKLFRVSRFLTAKQCDESHDYEPTLKFKWDRAIDYAEISD